MFCQNCGTQMDGDVEFCPKCGTKIGLSVQTANKPKGIITSVIGVVIMIISFAIPKNYSNDGYMSHIQYLTVPKYIVLAIGIIILIGGIVSYVKNKNKEHTV